MLWYSETVKTALDALRSNKVKAFLTMLGVVIGSACIVLVVTVGLTGKRYILAQIEGVGSNLVYAYYTGAGSQGQKTRPLADEITLADMDAVRRQVPQVAQVAGTYDVQMTTVVGGKEIPVSLVGVTEGFQQIRNLLILKGRFLDPIDMQTRAKAALVTRELAAKLPYGDPVGKTIRVGELEFTIIGVFRERVATFGQSEITTDSVIIPFSLIKYYTGQEFMKTLYAQAAMPQDVPAVTRQVREVLKSRHRPEAVYTVENLGSLLDAARTISLALTTVLIVIASIALIISGIGIMNIMLVTVTERTREIGIRMAVGARKAEIRFQFLIEAFLISGTGALIGIAIAVSIPVLLQPLLPDNLSVPISFFSVVLSFMVSSFIGVLFGYLPANRASKLQPTESLHHE